jgi:4-hydroxybenzoate polyprenyltransferase
MQSGPRWLAAFVETLRWLPRTPAEWRAARDLRLARGPRGVDRAWYLETYPDVAAARVDPVHHYLRYGWHEGRDPRPDFSTRGYLTVHEEVARARQNPLIHHLRHDRHTAPRDASGMSTDDELARGERGVDQAWYLARYPDIAAAGMDPVHHYLQFGWREGRDPRRDFSTRGYLAIRDDVACRGSNPFIHYLRHGGPKGPLRDVAPTSWHSLSGSIGRMARIAEWWDYKLIPILSIFYATALVENVSLAAMWPSLLALVCAVVACAVYVSFVNDVTDRADDRRADKPNRLADKPPWVLAVLLAVPLCIGAAFSAVWRDDPILVAAYVCTWAAFSLYSIAPVRLKGRGILGVVADAAGAHLFPAIVAALLALRAAGRAIDPVWIGGIVAWGLGCGLRGIVWHQIHDLEHDRKAGVRTFVLRHSRRGGMRLASWVALPLETIGLAVLLWRMQSLVPLAALPLYAAYASLRWKLWAIPVVVAAPRERYSVLGEEYYGLLLPLGILISSALRQPIDSAVLAVHLLLFPGPAIGFAMQASWLARDVSHARR